MLYGFAGSESDDLRREFLPKSGSSSKILYIKRLGIVLIAEKAGPECVIRCRMDICKGARLGR